MNIKIRHNILCFNFFIFPMPIDKVRKRNQELVPFDRARIEKALEKACEAVGQKELGFISNSLLGI